MKIGSAPPRVSPPRLVKEEVEQTGLEFYEPKLLPMPWDFGWARRKQLDATRVARRLNQGSPALEVKIKEGGFPVASAGDFRALGLLQKATGTSDTAPLLAQQLQQLLQAGFAVSGINSYHAYLELQRGETLKIAYAGHPVGELRGNDLSGLQESLSRRAEQVELALSNQKQAPGQAFLTSFDLCQEMSLYAVAGHCGGLSPSRYRDGFTQEQAKAMYSFARCVSQLEPAEQRQRLVALAPEIPGIPFEARINAVDQAGLLTMMTGDEAVATLQAAHSLSQESTFSKISEESRLALACVFVAVQKAATSPFSNSEQPSLAAQSVAGYQSLLRRGKSESQAVELVQGLLLSIANRGTPLAQIGSQLRAAIELGAGPPDHAVQVVESKRQVTIGGITIKKKQSP